MTYFCLNKKYNMNIVKITFKAGQKIYEFGPTGEYEISNLSGEDLMKFKKYFVENYKMIFEISAPTEWII